MRTSCGKTIVNYEIDGSCATRVLMFIKMSFWWVDQNLFNGHTRLVGRNLETSVLSYSSSAYNAVGNVCVARHHVVCKYIKYILYKRYRKVKKYCLRILKNVSLGAKSAHDNNCSSNKKHDDL